MNVLLYCSLFPHKRGGRSGASRWLKEGGEFNAAVSGEEGGENHGGNFDYDPASNSNSNGRDNAVINESLKAADLMELAVHVTDGAAKKKSIMMINSMGLAIANHFLIPSNKIHMEQNIDGEDSINLDRKRRRKLIDGQPSTVQNEAMQLVSPMNDTI